MSDFEVLSADSMVVGRVYEVKARNFDLGVWDGEGFLGHRVKFGSHYVDREYHIRHRGSAAPTRDTGYDVPNEIPLLEILDGSWCSVCHKLVDFDANRGEGYEVRWQHIEPADDGHIVNPYCKSNTDLLDWLVSAHG